MAIAVDVAHTGAMRALMRRDTGQNGVSDLLRAGRGKWFGNACAAAGVAEGDIVGQADLLRLTALLGAHEIVLAGSDPAMAAALVIGEGIPPAREMGSDWLLACFTHAPGTCTSFPHVHVIAVLGNAERIAEVVATVPTGSYALT